MPLGLPQGGMRGKVDLNAKVAAILEEVADDGR